ncbi:MAG: toprim domain-containing protein, partial [Promicromonosporaceae bacterium]|nr:toprim domain-containing protein [Promicromonosporaceae bacterium]
QLFANPEAKAGRKFLADRAFTKADAERFGVGYAPKGWNHLRDYLQGRGFTQDELLAAGLVKQGDRSLYDAFRGRLIWPIKDTSGAVVGFGARKLYDDDPGPKFLNTSETQLYKKSQVFYGIEQAKKAIARDKRVVIVEGYGDVMAAHLSGVDGAIAACGTSFTSDHARLIRRLMGDFAAGGGMQLTSGQTLGGEVIFVFDGDSAGQKAAERAFGEDQRFHALTFVAVAADGMDPCDLRLASGPEAVRALVESRVPLFEFVIKQALGRFDLNTVDGRLAALRVTAGYVAGIRDQALQHGYARTLAGWIGMEPEEVSREVRRAAKRVGQGEGAPGTAAAPPPTATAQPDPRDPVAATERLALAAVLQYPQHVPPEFDAFAPEAFSAPLWRAVFVAISAAGGAAAGAKQSTVKWVAAVEEEGGEALAAAIAQLSVMVLPEDREEAVARYVAGVIRAVADRDYTRQIADARSRLQRTDAAVDPAGHRAAMEAMLGAEAKRRALREA